MISIIEFSFRSSLGTALPFIHQPSLPIFFCSSSLFPLFSFLIQERFETVLVSKWGGRSIARSFDIDSLRFRLMWRIIIVVRGGRCWRWRSRSGRSSLRQFRVSLSTSQNDERTPLRFWRIRLSLIHSSWSLRCLRRSCSSPCRCCYDIALITERPRMSIEGAAGWRNE